MPIKRMEKVKISVLFFFALSVARRLKKEGSKEPSRLVSLTHHADFSGFYLASLPEVSEEKNG